MDGGLDRQRARVLQFTAGSALIAFTGFFFGGSFWYFAFFMIAVNLFTSAQGPLSDALILSEMQGNMSRYGQLRLWGSVGYVFMTAASGFVLDWTGIGLMPWVGAASRSRSRRQPVPLPDAANTCRQKNGVGLAGDEPA